MRQPFLVLLAFLSVSGVAWAQGSPLGPEFRINSYTTGIQVFSSVAADSVGNFVVLWHSLDQDGAGFGVFGQRYMSAGSPLGTEFRVNTHTTGSQAYPSVAFDSSGNFVVVWQSYAQDGSAYGVFGQRYASSGVPLSPEFRVNTYTTFSQYLAAVASDISGNFVVVWTDSGHDGSFRGIFGQRYANSGAPLGSEFQVNSYTTGNQSYSSVACDSSGNFVVVWSSQGEDGSSAGVFGQRYASAGTPLGPEFRVNSYTTGLQGAPAIAADSSGNFVAAWWGQGQDGSSYGVFGQRYASSGTALGPEFRVNTYTTGDQRYPSIGIDSSGNFVVVWESLGQDGSSAGVFGQRYANTGTSLGQEFRVNSYTTGAQSATTTAADSAGNFIVTWTSDAQNGSSFGVFGQRYSQIVPVELIHFRVE